MLAKTEATATAVDLQSLTASERELKDAMHEVFQGRSAYQLKRFVVGSHATPERQYAQCVLELQNKYFSIRRADVNLRRMQSEMASETDQFAMESKAIDIEQTEIAMVGALREFSTLLALFRSMPNFTAREMEEAEDDYWIERLKRQAQQDIDATGTISVGNAEALRQSGVLDGFAERFDQIASAHPGLANEVRKCLP